jgi:hypothetical protein
MDLRMRHRVAVCILAAAAFLAAATANAVAAKVGVAGAIKNDVRRGSQPLATGGDVFTNERIRTGEASNAQILFLDKTALMIGPSAEVTLDSFVYDPSKGNGRVVMNAVQGAFRFVTGSQNPKSYTIKTPVGTLGVRGTIGEVIVMRGPTPAQTTVTVILVEGSLTMTVFGKQYTLTKPGTSFVFSADGTVQGPATWDGTIMNTGGSVGFPMYGWQFQGEQPINGLPTHHTGSIDQLNGVIQRALTAPVVMDHVMKKHHHHHHHHHHGGGPRN